LQRRERERLQLVIRATLKIGCDLALPRMFWHAPAGVRGLDRGKLLHQNAFLDVHRLLSGDHVVQIVQRSGLRSLDNSLY